MATMNQSIKEEDLKLFVDSVRHYFSKSTNEEASITSAYLGTDNVDTYEFNGIVTFSGSYNGQIIVSMSEKLLYHLLISQAESNLSHENMLDIVGEIANTLAGNARKNLKSGENLSISVPVKTQGNHASTRGRVRQHPYIISMSWKGFPAIISIDIEKVS